MPPPDIDALTARLLTPADAPTVHAAHLAILRSVGGPEFLYPRSLDYFRRLTDGGGRVVGIFSGSELAGYAALRLPGEGRGSHAAHLRHLGVEPGEVAEGGGGGVVPEFRGCRLMRRLVRERDDVARALGFRVQTSVVWPENRQALAAMLENGFSIAARLVDDDGANYLTAQALCAPPPAQGDGARVDVADVVSNLRHLDEGLCGIPHGTGRDLHLRYRRLDPATAFGPRRPATAFGPRVRAMPAAT